MMGQQSFDEFKARAAALKQPQTPPPKPALKVVSIKNEADQTEGTTTITEQLASVKAGCETDALFDAINEINAKHFVSTEGGKVRIFAETVDPELGNPSLISMSVADFRTLNANRFVRVTNGQGEARSVCIADVWLKSPDRREYPNGIGLFPDGNSPPGTYNLWRGFGVEPVKGDPKQSLTFIKHVVCGGDERVFMYLLGLLATFVQKPGDPAEVAIVMRGGRGVGKSTLGRWFVQIFGGHGMHVLHSRHLVGNFNAHLRGTCLLFADEAFFAGDRAGSDVLKGLITEPTITIERKGIDAFAARNRLKIMMASNSEWVVPAGTDERRYLMLDVPDVKKQDSGYFSKLAAHMETGGLGALLWFLLNYDLSKFNVRDVPRTGALDRQKLLSLPPLLAWIYDRLYAGHLLESDPEWKTECRRDAVVTAFAEHVRRGGLRYVAVDAAAVGRGLRAVFPDLGETNRRIGNGQRARCWVFPTLTEARGQFERVVLSGSVTEWPADDE